MADLLTRDQFRNAVFARDKGACVFCGLPAKDAHHIIERRLWPDGGYYLDNGASVCEQHHLECEQTLLSVETVRDACKITRVLVPPHLYADQPYDKWGNPILPNGQRCKGELFNDPSVQKVLADFLRLFTDRVKYPRTYHLPWSPGMNDDDRMMESLDAFKGQRVIVTEKMDGENTTLYRDYFHARSVSHKPHESQTWVKQLHSKFAHDIPPGWRICGENLFAKHSIAYDKLPSYFLGFAIWNDRNECLSWDETLDWFKLLDITPVRVLYDGIYEEEAELRETCLAGLGNTIRHEGYVLRLADAFPYGEFRRKVGKYVRKDHVQTVQHWRYGQRIEKNELAP